MQIGLINTKSKLNTFTQIFCYYHNGEHTNAAYIIFIINLTTYQIIKSMIIL